MVEDDKNGVKPLYRSAEWDKEARKNAKVNKKFNWWNNIKSEIQYKSVCFVTPTPGGILVKDLTRR